MTAPLIVSWKSLAERFVDRFRRRLTVNIACPHGTFVPATYSIGRNARLSCDDCRFKIRLSWTRRTP